MIKKNLTLLLLFLVCCVQSALADFEVVIDGIKYKYGIFGSSWEYYLLVMPNDYSGDIVVPATIVYNGKEYPVDGCYSSCFKNCSNLTSVTISEGVSLLLSNCFDGCSSLTSVTIPESVTYIGASCFSGCSSLANITIPDGVTSLPTHCFLGCI